MKKKEIKMYLNTHTIRGKRGETISPFHLGFIDFVVCEKLMNAHKWSLDSLDEAYINKFDFKLF